MKDEQSKNIFDSTLTPKNAAYKGYQYIDDVILDKNSTQESSIEFLDVIKKNGFRLGIPERNGSEYVGLYIPTVEIEKTI